MKIGILAKTVECYFRCWCVFVLILSCTELLIPARRMIEGWYILNFDPVSRAHCLPLQMSRTVVRGPKEKFPTKVTDSELPVIRFSEELKKISKNVIGAFCDV